MSLIGRYIFRQAALAFIVSLVTLTGIIWLTQAMREIDVVAVQGQSLFVFVVVTLLALPSSLSIIAPVALLIATLHTLNRLNADSEMVVLSAAGSSRWRIVAPFLALGLLVSLLVGTLTIYVMPQSLAALREIITDVRASLISHIIQPGLFSTPEPGLTIHIRARTAQGELKGLLLTDTRDKEQQLTYLADSGSIVENDKGTFLVMQEGTVQRQEGIEPNKVQIVAFDRYVVDLSQLSRSTRDVIYKPRERSTLYLFAPRPDDHYYKVAPGRFRSELHERLSSPLLPIGLVMISLATVGFARTTREGRGLGLALAIGLAILAQILEFGAINMSARAAWAVPFTYIIPSVLIVGGGACAFGLFRFKHRYILLGWIETAWDISTRRWRRGTIMDRQP